MKPILCILLVLSVSTLMLQAQDEKATPIYAMYLNVIEDAQTIKDLEEKTKTKIVARMTSKRKIKIISYYSASKNEFVGFTADLDKIDIRDVPYFRSLKGLKDYLKKDTDPRQALTRYYVNHPKPTINIYD